MRIDAAFPSKYLKGAELSGKTVRVIIARVEIEEIAEGEHKPVVYFENKNKGIVLNRINADTISSAFGMETDDWLGKEIELYFEENVYYGPKRVGGLRVRIPQKTRLVNNPPPQRTVPRQAPEPAPEQFDERNPPDSDIPF